MAQRKRYQALGTMAAELNVLTGKVENEKLGVKDGGARAWVGSQPIFRWARVGRGVG